MMQKRFLAPRDQKHGIIVVVLLIFLAVYAMAASFFAGLYIYRVTVRPAMYFDVYDMCMDLDTEYLADHSGILHWAGYYLAEDERDYQVYLHKDVETRSSLCIYVYPNGEGYDPYFFYQKDFTYTLIPFDDGYTFYFDDGNIYLEMITYSEDSVMLVYDAISELVQTVEEYASSK